MTQPERTKRYPASPPQATERRPQYGGASVVFTLGEKQDDSVPSTFSQALFLRPPFSIDSLPVPRKGFAPPTGLTAREPVIPLALQVRLRLDSGELCDRREGEERREA